MSDAAAGAQAPQKDYRSNHELASDIARTRSELVETLDALEYKLDVPARAREMLDEGPESVKRLWDDNPLLVAGLAVGAVALVGGAVAGLVALFRR